MRAVLLVAGSDYGSLHLLNYKMTKNVQENTHYGNRMSFDKEGTFIFM